MKRNRKGHVVSIGCSTARLRTPVVFGGLDVRLVSRDFQGLKRRLREFPRTSFYPDNRLETKRSSRLCRKMF